MSQLSSRIARALAISLSVVAVVAACGSEGGSNFDPSSSSGATSNGSSTGGVNNGSSGGFLPSSASSSGASSTSSSGTSGDIDPLCKPLTCAEQNINCGLAGDGCGRQINCDKTKAEGGCSDDPTMRCGAEGKPSQCVPITVAATCTPKTCDQIARADGQLGVKCGPAGDGCGSLIQSCGTCASDEQCGGPGQPSVCVKITATSADGGACVKLTPADYLADNKDCGRQSDGCGGFIELGNCVDPEFCGGGGPSKCAVSGGGTCTKKTCADYTDVCGPQPDGCGGVTPPCGPGCTPPQVCGGGGVPGKCGGGILTDDAGNACTPKSTCGPLECGEVPDGCGSTFNCGLTRCVNGNICGGGGTPNVCGKPACTTLSRAQACAGKNCGSVGDGCGGTYNCNPNDAATACTAPAICGGGGVPNVCGGGVPTADGGPGGGTCVPRTATSCTAGDCGPFPNGCGGVYYCCNGAACAQNPPPSTALCTAGNTCGALTDSKCGSPQCTATTQAAACAGKNCGFVSDGCGGSHQCGVGSAACPVGANIGDVCGGGGQANVCGGGVPCTGFCQNVNRTCAANDETAVSGRVFAPDGLLPLPNALVYVPNGGAAPTYGVQPISTGIATGGTCETCAGQASGSPLVSTTSGSDGSFTLRNVPAGVSFPLVIQLGKWRRMIMVGSVPACTQVQLNGSNSNRPLPRLPTRQGEGSTLDNIPFVGISTGAVDGLECVFRKLGIEDTMFGNPVGTTGTPANAVLDRGRIRLHRHNDGTSGGDQGGAVMSSLTPRTNESLTDSQAHLDQYDAVIFSCPGQRIYKSTAIEDRIRNYAERGGRVFATHFEHTLLENNGNFATTADWDPQGNPSPDTWTGNVDTSPGKRLTFSQWLNAPGVNALSNVTPPRVSIVEARNDVNLPVANGAESWITHGSGSTADILHFTFDTPVGATNTCGRVLFSDFHVSIGNTAGDVFPDHCTGGLTNQEKILAFFLFDLTSCIDSGPPPTTCNKQTCQGLPQTGGTPPGAICGQHSDGCGDLIRVDPNNPNSAIMSCGTCPTGQACVGGYCQVINCTRNTCQPGQCGDLPDGCGGTITCNCAPGTGTCGGGGQANRCGTPNCTPLTCQAGFCGSTGNGCGGTLDCTCPPNQQCGAGNPGQPNRCGTCQRITQCPAGKNCGDIPDGCGGKVHCGDCATGQACGGSGQANVCGQGSCIAKSCAELGAQCGQISDGCGDVTTCPNCQGGDFCNAQNLCVPPTCTPKDCASQGIECGPASNTCGGFIDSCGTCPAGKACGAGGQPGKCGTIPCNPSSCTDLGAVCGQVANGCGGLTTNCGSCPGTQSCVNGACVQSCTPLTCAEAGDAKCGFVGDGCGGALDCGQCPNGQTCGTGNKCTSDGPK